MKKSWLVLIIASALPCFAFSCSNIYTTARDTIATNYGFLTYAQAQFGPSCSANPTQTVCQVVKTDIPFHNALIDALEAACGGTPAAGQQSFANGGNCVPVSGLQATLQAALNALTPIMNELKPLINVAATPAPVTTPALKLTPKTTQHELLEEHRL